MNTKLVIVSCVLAASLGVITWFNVNTYDEGEFVQNTLQAIAGAAAVYLAAYLKSD